MLRVQASLLCFMSSLAAGAATAPDACLTETGSQVWIEGGEFRMGDDNTYREEGPARNVRVDGFWIDAHEVTNAQFAAFVADTGYVTVAERPKSAQDFPGAGPEMLKPGSVTFTPPDISRPFDSWWSYTPGADWRHPEGPASSIEGRDNYPVVQVAFEDAQAYAEWAGRALPTEAQFEYAARSKRDGEHYAWGGDSLTPAGRHMANTWQGLFPVQNTAADGHSGLAPVGCYPANDWQVYDLIGNAWEWTQDWYAPSHDAAASDNPTGPPAEKSFDPANAGFPVRVIKGGSFLCAPNYCKRYRPAARHAQDTGLGTGHIGFRTVLNSQRVSER